MTSYLYLSIHLPDFKTAIGSAFLELCHDALAVDGGVDHAVRQAEVVHHLHRLLLEHSPAKYHAAR